MKSYCFPKMKAVWAFGQSLNFKRLVFRGGREGQSNKSWVFIPELAHHPDCSFRAPKAKSQPQHLNRPWCRQTPRPTPLPPPSTQRLGPIVLVEGLGFRFLGLGVWGLKVSGLLTLWGFGVRIWGLSLILYSTLNGLKLQGMRRLLPELPGPGSCYQNKAIEKGLQHN